MKPISIALATIGLVALAWTGIIFVRDRGASQPATTVPVEDAVPGPSLGGTVQSGLQLRFTVESPTSVDGPHQLRLQLVNVSDASIELVSRWYARWEDAAPTRDTLFDRVGFVVFPEIERDSWQTISGPDRVEMRDSRQLGPGEHVEVQWDCVEDRIVGPGISREFDSSYRFLTTGLYFVRARIDVETGNDGVVRLWSNEAPYVVGGSHEGPKAHVVQLRRDPRDNSSFGLSCGRMDGLEIGDVFRARMGLEGGTWEFAVTEVAERGSTARCTYTGSASTGETRELPLFVSEAQLLRPVSRASRAVRPVRQASATNTNR